MIQSDFETKTIKFFIKKSDLKHEVISVKKKKMLLIDGFLY